MLMSLRCFVLGGIMGMLVLSAMPVKAQEAVQAEGITEVAATIAEPGADKVEQGKQFTASPVEKSDAVLSRNDANSEVQPVAKPPLKRTMMRSRIFSIDSMEQ
jgi:hypothetical protein